MLFLFKGSRRVVNLLVVIVLILVGLIVTIPSAAQAPPPTEKEAVDHDGFYPGLGPGPIWFDEIRSGKELTREQVRTGLERWLSMIGNPRLKVGAVIEKDGHTISAEIVTVDNSLVQKIDIDRETGIVWQMQHHNYWMLNHPGSQWGRGRDYRGHGWTPFPFIFALFLIAIVLVVALLIPGMFRPHSSPLEILSKRYVRGEISSEEYLKRKRELSK